MSGSLTIVSYGLPLWFLVLALFLPRVTLVLAWFWGDLVRFHLMGLLPPILALFLPRVLILMLIYRDQGFGLWFVVHLVVALMVWGGSGQQAGKRRRKSD